MRRILSQHPEAEEAFERLSYFHRKEYVECIEEAKRPETRARRVEKVLARLMKGRKPG